MGSIPRLIAIVGPTASGKSDLALRLAKEFNGELICADSRTVYRGMDIGTAKPSKADQKTVKHWGLDLVEPGKTYSAAKFKEYAQSAIEDIQNRGKLSILVGGTGLYIDGVLYGYGFSLKARERDPINARHLKKGTKATRGELLPGALMIGLMPPEKVLKERIASRAGAIFRHGIVKETQGLLDKYGQKAVTSTAGIVYKIIMRLLDGEISEEEAAELFKTADWQYARRQKTWFKRNAHIKWFNSAEEAYEGLTKLL
jgi:tRNA dimethylallyltransferase